MEKQVSKSPDTGKRTLRIIIGGATAAMLALLALRYPALPASIPTQIRLDGTLGNYIPKPFFALAVAAGLLGFNAYLLWIRDPEEPVRFMTLAVFLLVCGGIAFSLLV